MMKLFRLWSFLYKVTYLLSTEVQLLVIRSSLLMKVPKNKAMLLPGFGSKLYSQNIFLKVNS